MSSRRYSRHESSRRDRFYSWRDRIVFISNIPFHYKAQDVMLLFRQFGRCFRVDLARSEIGKSRGLAFAEFEKTDSARLAVEYLDGAQIDNQHLRVELSQYPPDDLVKIYKDTAKERAQKDREEGRVGPSGPRSFRRIFPKDDEKGSKRRSHSKKSDKKHSKSSSRDDSSSSDSESSYSDSYYSYDYSDYSSSSSNSSYSSSSESASSATSD